MDSVTRTVIIGAGPYGLSLAAHLRSRGVPFRIFGRAMETWATQMPEGMKLKSDGFASNLYPGSGSFTLEQFCQETGRPYHPTDHPVAVQDFVDYGCEFARRFAPNLEERRVTMIQPFKPLEPTEEANHSEARFLVTLEDGESLLASEVVLAVGLSYFPLLPDVVRSLPAEMVSHTTDHRVFEQFRGCPVTVLGRGASALNAAALLHESGARPTLISRKTRLHLHRPAESAERSFLERLRHPSSPLGPSLRSWFASRFPLAFHALPRALQRGAFYKHLGPAGGVSLRGRVRGKVPLLMGWSIAHAELLPATERCNRRIKLTLVNNQHQVREHITTHIVAGTGFRVDIKRLRFLSPELLAGMRTEDHGAPRLNRNFCTAVPGLYVVGPAAAASFGPLLRFAAGAQFASAQLSEHLSGCYARAERRSMASSFEAAPARESQAA